MAKKKSGPTPSSASRSAGHRGYRRGFNVAVAGCAEKMNELDAAHKREVDGLRNQLALKQGAYDQAIEDHRRKDATVAQQAVDRAKFKSQAEALKAIAQTGARLKIRARFPFDLAALGRACNALPDDGWLGRKVNLSQRVRGIGRFESDDMIVSLPVATFQQAILAGVAGKSVTLATPVKFEDTRKRNGKSDGKERPPIEARALMEFGNGDPTQPALLEVLLTIDRYTPAILDALVGSQEKPEAEMIDFAVIVAVSRAPTLLAEEVGAPTPARFVGDGKSTPGGLDPSES